MIVGSFDQMEEVGELTIHEGGDSCDEELIQINKFTSDVEEAAIKLLASRLVVVSPFPPPRNRIYSVIWFGNFNLIEVFRRMRLCRMKC